MMCVFECVFNPLKNDALKMLNQDILNQLSVIEGLK